MPGLGGITATPARMLLGPANIWVGVTVPTTGTQLSLTSGAPADGTNIGATASAATFVFTPTVHEFMVEQALSPIDFAATVEAASIDFDVIETVGLNLSKLLQGSTAVASGSTQWVYGGGTLQPPSQSVVLIHPRRDVAKYSYILLYKAFIKDAITIPFSRTAPTTWKVKLTALADITRAVGDQLYQVVPQTN